MNANTLISKIQRVIDLQGEYGDAESLLRQYAEAVKQANERLARCDAYLQEKQISEAMRIADEHPQLVDLCATLAFAQYPVWRELCQGKGWALPPEVDEDAVVRLQTLFEGNAAIKSLNELHRRAVRRHDDALRMSCLRRLIDADSRNAAQWSQDLAVLESRAMTAMLSRLRDAQRRGDAAETDAVIADFSSERWRNPVLPGLQQAIEGSLAVRKQAEQTVQFAEDYALLEKASGAKNFELSLKVSQSIEDLQRNGFTIPAERIDFLGQAREWLVGESAEREQRQAYQSRVSELVAAIEMDDEMGVRALLSAPEFLEANLDEDLERRARDCVRRGELRRDRKRRQIVALVSFLFAGVAVVSGIRYRAFRFDQDKRALIGILEAEFNKKDAVALGRRLQQAETNAPAIWKDPDIQSWCRKQRELAAENEKKCAGFDRLATDLEQDEQSRFEGADPDKVRARLKVAQELLLPGDVSRDTRLSRLRVAFEQQQSDVRTRREQAAQAAFDALRKPVESAISDYQRLDLKAKMASPEKASVALGSWRDSHGGVLPTLDAEASSLQAQLAAASQAHAAYTNLLFKFQPMSFASDDDHDIAQSMVATWQTLVENFPQSPYAGVGGQLASMPFVDAVTLKLGCHAKTKERADKLRGLTVGLPSEDIADLLAQIVSLEQYPVLTQLHVLCRPQSVEEDIKKPKVVFRGRRPVRTMRTNIKFEWDGDWMRPGPPRREDAFHDDAPYEWTSDLQVEPLPHCRYYNDIIAIAHQNPGSGELKRKLLASCVEILADRLLSECLRAYVLSEFFGMLANLCDIEASPALSAYQRDLALLSAPVGGTPNKEYFFLYTEEGSVKGREQACKDFFTTHPNIMREFDSVEGAVCEFLLQCRPRLVACVDVTSTSDAPAFKWRHAEVPDGELYALRQISGMWKFRLVFRASPKENKLFRVAVDGAFEPLLPGEPLFTLARAVGKDRVGLADGVGAILREHERKFKYKSTVLLPPAWPEGLAIQ